MTTPKVIVNANPAAIGFRWVGDGNHLHELVWLRSEDRPWMYGVLIDGKWNTTSAPGVERAATAAEARRIAEAFVAAGYSE